MNPYINPDPQQLDAEDLDQIKKLKTGFQAKYQDPVYRRLFLDRTPIIKGRIPSQSPAWAETTDNKEDTKRLDRLVETSEEPLLQVKTVFPFVFFTNEVIVDINKVSIVYRNFFASQQLHSVLIKDVSDVVVETSLFFATLKIVDIGYTENTIDVDYLTKDDGTLARRVIQGLVMAHRHNIDLTKVERVNLLEKLESMGTNSAL